MQKTVDISKLLWQSVNEIMVKNCFNKILFFLYNQVNEVNEDILKEKCQVLFTFQKRNYIKLYDNLECYEEQHCT